MSIKSMLVAAALALAATTATASGTQSLKAEVNGMVCSFCAQGIEKRMKALPATQAVFVDLRNKVVAVEMKPGQNIDEKTFRSEMTEAGYDVVRLELVAQTAADIRAASRRK